jgi:carbonic anhydrase/acetyltransferase-like protein (isoleucine patch superfamily)
MKKYELLGVKTLGRGLYRIRALKDFSDVKAGDLGGFVESKRNLSQEDNCWVYDSALVTENAYVFGNARIFDHAAVFGDARVCRDAHVFGSAQVFGNAMVSGDERVFGNSTVHGQAVLGPIEKKNVESSAIYDLEQHIMDVWRVVDDIKLTTAHFIDEEKWDGMSPQLADALTNKYGAVEELYELKFVALWTIFEKLCGELSALKRAQNER